MLRIYAPVPTNYNAQKFYRVLQPLSAMAEIDRANSFIDNMTHELDQMRGAASTLASVHLLHLWHSKSFQDVTEQLAMQNSHWLPTEPDAPREWDTAATPVIDTDDDLFNSMPVHGTFRWAGTKNAEGGFLQPGDSIGWEEEATGEKTILWEDGKDGFDIARNLATISQWRTNLRLSAVVTCSTNRLARALELEVPGIRTLVVPNCIDFRHYPKLDLSTETPVRILWQGGDGHQLCLKSVSGAIGRLAAKYPDVEWVFFGAEPPVEVVKAVDNYTYIGWVPYQEYKLRLNCIGHDIAIAPLYDCAFNDSRSAIKAYEAAACWKPAATVAKNMAQFADDIIEGETGLLYDTEEEFETKLESLIVDKKLRTGIASNMKDWIGAHRNPLAWASVMADEFDNIRNLRKSLRKPPIDPHPLDVENGVLSAE